MTKNPIRIIYFFAFTFIVSCSKKGEAIIEPFLGNYTFTTYTIDTTRFKVMLKGEVFTDSLQSPNGSFSKNVFFNDDTLSSLKIYDTRNDQLVIDTNIILKKGRTIIPLVQFLPGERPYLPPLPNEAPPLPGHYKIRFQYVLPALANVPVFDSATCIIRNGNVPKDTVVLQKFSFTNYYEFPIGSSCTIRLEDPANGNSLIDLTTNSVGSSLTGFNTAIVYYSSGITAPYNFLVKVVY